MTALATRVREIIAEETDRSLDDLTDDRRIDDLGIDSLDRILIVMDLEEEFGVSITDRDSRRWSKIGDVIATVDRLMNDRGEMGAAA